MEHWTKMSQRFYLEGKTNSIFIQIHLWASPFLNCYMNVFVFIHFIFFNCNILTFDLLF